MKPSHAILFFTIGTLLMILFYQNEILLFLVMIAASAAALAIDKWKNLKYFLMATFIGGICENISVFLGAWKYANTNFLPAPIWVPIGWGIMIVLLEEAFGDVQIKASKKALGIAFAGAVGVGLMHPTELGLFAAALIGTGALVAFKYDKLKHELRIGLMGALFGSAMEIACISSGNWQYSNAMWIIPLWLPFCWFNAFLIMRRIIRL